MEVSKNISVERGVTSELYREAKRVIHTFPNWIPAEVQSKAVSSKYRLPIVFAI